MVFSVEFERHQIFAHGRTKFCFKAVMEFFAYGIDFAQRFFRRMVTTNQSADNHSAAYQRTADMTSMTNATTKTGAKTQSVIVNVNASSFTESFYDSFAAVKALFKIVAYFHTHFFAEFTHDFASFYHSRSRKASSIPTSTLNQFKMYSKVLAMLSLATVSISLS